MQKSEYVDSAIDYFSGRRDGRDGGYDRDQVYLHSFDTFCWELNVTYLIPSYINCIRFLLTLTARSFVYS
jgi:hypothetical protein